MITYIEGVDGSGKSTLVKTLVNEFNCMQVELPKRQDDKVAELNEWRKWCDKYCTFRKLPEVYIADRSMISELVYRMEDLQDTFLTKEILQKFLIGAQFVYCISLSSYKDAIVRGDDNIKSLTQHLNRVCLYDGIMYLLEKVYNVPVLTYNWRHDKINKVLKFINQGVNKIWSMTNL